MPVSEPAYQRPWYDVSLGQGFTLPTGGAHDGRDVQTPIHTPLTSLVSGIVTPHTGFYPWGGEVDVLTPSGVTETFAHLDALAVHPGENIAIGQVLGLSGGENLPKQYSTGPHTHVSFFGGAPWDNSKAIDPTPVLAAAQHGIFGFFGGGPLDPSITGGLAGTAGLPNQQTIAQAAPGVAQVAGSPISVTVQSGFSTLLQSLTGVSGSSDFLWRAGLIVLGISLIIVGVLVTIWPAAKQTGQAATQATVAAAKVAAVAA